MFQSKEIINIELNKNLVKSLRRGEPWLYSDAILTPSKRSVSLAKVFYKKKHIAWGYYDPHSPIAVRILSSEPKWSFSYSKSKLIKLLKAKTQAFRSETNNSFRAVNGEGDFFPGLICDVYNELAVLQADGEGPYQIYDWNEVADLVKEHTGVKYVYFKARNQHKVESRFLSQECPCPVRFLENSCAYWVNFVDGQKTGFFLDQRNNRQYLGQHSNGKSLLNLFSYTGGFSVAAGVGGASQVVSVDISHPACEYAQKNWDENSLSPSNHSAVAENVFSFIDTQLKDKKSYDIVVCDPPSFSNNESGKSVAIKKYIDVFSKAALLVDTDGDLVLSSCSSHINYEDFFSICEEAVANAKRKAQVVYMGTQADCHTYPLAFRKMQYLKFLHLRLN